jgi:hypothetical protein
VCRLSDQPEWAEAASRGTTRDVTFPSCNRQVPGSNPGVGSEKAQVRGATALIQGGVSRAAANDLLTVALDGSREDIAYRSSVPT